MQVLCIRAYTGLAIEGIRGVLLILRGPRERKAADIPGDLSSVDTLSEMRIKNLRVMEIWKQIPPKAPAGPMIS
jgi:hypothetical protein